MCDNFEKEMEELAKPRSNGNAILMLLTVFCIAIFVFLIVKSMQVKNRSASTPVILENGSDDIDDKDFENKANIDGLNTDFYDLIDNDSDVNKDDEDIVLNNDDYSSDKDLESKISELFDVDSLNSSDKKEVKVNDNIKNVFVNENSTFDDVDIATTINGKHGIKVQLAALKTNDFAIEYKNNIVSKYNSLFKNLEFFIKKVDLMDKGIFYRVQFGVFRDKKEAKMFCEKYIKISNNNLSSCIVVDD
mgnify:CR=1 FL=1